MKKIIINENDAQQRLDRFLRKYLNGASLSYIYKIIRKDVKINGKRGRNDTVLQAGDEITLYIPDDVLEKYSESRTSASHTRRSFGIAYEDDNIIAVIKPFGLLTHGDGREKKNTLVNQVVDYLIEKKEYNPRTERTFVPAAVNRLDRNTTGLVLFGKNSMSLRALNQMIREKGCVSKFYLTIVSGKMDSELHLTGGLAKDTSKNMVRITESAEDGGKSIETFARPVLCNGKFTLAEVELITGRTHQIRAHMASAGYPVIGDAKYGNPKVNRRFSDEFGLTTQLLHAYRLEIVKAAEGLEYLEGKVFKAELPEMFSKIKKELFRTGGNGN